MRRWSKACNTPTGRERERTGERESVSLPDLAQDLVQDLDRFGTRPFQQLSFYS
jgi:hypothetical protein